MILPKNAPMLLTAIIFIALLATPLYLWLFQGKQAIAFTSVPSVVTAIGQAAAIIGLTLFVLEFVLSARFRAVEWLLSGLNRVYVIHHLLGAAALITLLLHPLFLSLQYLAISPSATARFFFPSLNQTGQWLGIIALSVLILLLIFTFYIRLKYPTWKKTHQFLGVPLFFAFGHTLLVPGILSQNLPLKIYLSALYLVGIYAYAHRVLLKKWLVKKHRFFVVSVTPEKDAVLEIDLKPAVEKLTFQPGQFVFITVINHATIAREAHPFSLTSPAASPLLSIAPKAVGDFTQSLVNLKPGDKVLVEGPFGHFTQQKINHPRQIWIAGGIGITPFLSMARTFVRQQPTQAPKIHLFYSVKDIQTAPFIHELTDINQALPWFHLTLHSSAKKGRLTAAKITRTVKNASAYDVLMCGPVPMSDSLKTQFKKLGFKNHRLHTEVFKLLD